MKQFLMTLVFLGANVSLASGYDCSYQFIQYSSHSSDGGACCGHLWTELKYRGNSVKHMEIFRGFRGNDRVEDSNPNLVITEGSRTDLNDNSRNGDWEISHFSMEIELKTKNGADPIPGIKSPAVVTVTCKNNRYIGPPRP